jgi:NADH dehydrogenase
MVQTAATGPHVLVIGGGFGGLTVAQALARAPVRITLVDETNHHTFQPLLYQVAMAGLSPADIAQPIRSILRGQRNVAVLLAKVSRVDLAARLVHLEDGASIGWDYLVVACGANTAYFGHDDWASAGRGLKSIEDAIDIRQRVLLAFELAEREPDAKRREELLSFVVIGGGPTGVELAGALAELGRFVLGRDFRHIDPSSAQVRLIEAGPRILASFPPELAERARSQLQDLGVEVRAGVRVTSVERGCVRLGAERVGCSVVLWAAGVRANPLTRTLGVSLDSADRVRVEPDLSVPGHPHAFVIGDAAFVRGPNGDPLPGVSPVAMQQARSVARSIRRLCVGDSTTPFRYVDKGSMATIGRSRAIAVVGRLRLSGFIAWLTWLFVHIVYLIGFKNRIVVLINWAWSYATYRRGARLITGYAARDAIDALRVPPAPELESPARADASPARIASHAPRAVGHVPGHEGPR